MTKFTIALAAAALLAAPSFSSSAEAGGIRLGFGFPLGSFVAHPHQNYHATPSYRAEKHVARKASRAARYAKQDAAPVIRKAPKAKVTVAETAPVKRYKAPTIVKTANNVEKPVVSDAAPTVVIPEAPATVTPEIAKTTETAPVTTQTAAIEPAQTANVTEEVKIEEPKIEKVETVVKEEPKVSLSKAKRVCRRFSAAIAGLIDIPCE